MTIAEVENKIKKIIAHQLGCDISSIASNAHLQKDLYADSLDILSIKVSIEDAFDIVFTEKELQDLLYIDAIVEIIHGKLI